MTDLLHKVNSGGALADVPLHASAVRYLGDASRAPVMATPAVAGAVGTAVVGEGVTAGVGAGENLGTSEETENAVDAYNEKYPVGEE